MGVGVREKHHVVAEQVGVDGAARQRCVVRQRGNVVLVGQFRLQQLGLGRFQVRQDQGHGFVPPGQGAQIVLAQMKASAHQMHARQGGTHLCAVRGAGCEFALARQHVHHGGGFAAQGVHHFAPGVRRRVGYGNAVGGQVRHQAQVVGELFGGQALKQGQHVAGAFGVGKVVGVLDAARTALQAGQSLQTQAFEQGAGLRE